MGRGTRLLAGLALLFFAMALPAMAAAPSAVLVEGTHVSIVPPAGWTASTTFTGFEEKATAAAIMVNEMAGAPYSKVSGAYSKESMAAEGMQLVETVPFTFGTHKGILVEARQTAQGVSLVKWIACFGDES